jgi:hypothetical protein
MPVISENIQKGLIIKLLSWDLILYGIDHFDTGLFPMREPCKPFGHVLGHIYHFQHGMSAHFRHTMLKIRWNLGIAICFELPAP